MAEDFKLVDCNLGKDTDAEMTLFVDGQIEFLTQSHSDLHKNKIPKWRKLYLGIPMEDIKSFPWPNAANTIVQVIGETTDTLAARILGLAYATHPLWPFQDYRKFDPADTQQFEHASKERRTLEDFMDIMGFEPSELDLYRIEGLWCTDMIRLGTAFLKLGYEHKVETTNVGYTSARSKVIQGDETTIYSGPRVHKLRHEDVFLTPDASTPGEAEFVFQVRTLRRKALEERAFTGAYSKAAVDAILDSPDRNGPKPQEKSELQDQGIVERGNFDANAQWDIAECYYSWWHNDRKFRIIDSYHKRTKTVLRRVFNFLPQNELPILRARMGYRTDGMYGHGVAELLERYQEELSTVHNQRLDNATAANTRALRVSPRARNLDANVELYPMALLVGEKDDIEAIQIADVYPSSFENENVTLAHAQSRAGISPAISGSGGGGPQKKTGSYSSAGTLATMQESNSRVNLDASDFRHAHVKLGSLLTAMYAKYGVGDRAKMFGLDADILKSALKEFDKNRLAIPIRASTASLNREMDKQSDMLLAGLLQRHYTAVGQLMQAMSSPMIQPEVKDYMVKTVRSLDRFIKRVMKDFQYDQPEQYVPEPKLPDFSEGQGGKNPPPPPGGQVAPNAASIQSTAAATPGRGPANVPAPGVGGVAGGTPAAPGAGGGGPQV
jgi:hypothetical protein